SISRAGRGARGVWAKKSSKTGAAPSMRHRAKPPPPRDARTGSWTQAAKKPATAPSTALPPARRMSSTAAAVPPLPQATAAVGALTGRSTRSRPWRQGLEKPPAFVRSARRRQRHRHHVASGLRGALAGHGAAHRGGTVRRLVEAAHHALYQLLVVFALLLHAAAQVPHLLHALLERIAGAADALHAFEPPAKLALVFA